MVYSYVFFFSDLCKSGVMDVISLPVLKWHGVRCAAPFVGIRTEISLALGKQ